MLEDLRKLWGGERGAKALEYGLMVVAIAAVIATIVGTLGDIPSP